MRKTKWLKKFFKIIPPFTVKMVLLALVLYLFAFLHYDWVDMGKSESYNVVITDLEYREGHRVQWACFNANDVPAYFWLDTHSDYKKFEQLVNQKTEVTVTFSDYNSFVYAMDFYGRKQVADIRTEDSIIFNVEDYNKRILPLIIMWSIYATFCLGLGIARFIVYKKLKI